MLHPQQEQDPHLLSQIHLPAARMADALVQVAIENLTNIIQQELSLVCGAPQQLKNLSSTFQAIQAVLHDAETRQVNDEKVRDWLGKLKDVAYDVDDFLDEWEPTAHRSWESDSGRIRNKVRTCLFWPRSCFSRVMSRYNLAHGIKELKERLDQIADEKNKYNFNSSESSSQVSRLEIGRFQTSSLVDVSHVIGRVEDKDMIVSKLVSGSSREEGCIPVISIVGIGGLGKTTLARLVCNDEKVRSHFQKVLWVCVSEDFDLKRLTKAIIEDAEGVSTTLSELNPLQNKLIGTLRGKLILLVLDDVWNDDKEKWEELRLPFQSSMNGSRILVTTRSNKVASMMDASYLHKLGGLCDDDCWLLFRRRAFIGWEMEHCLELERIEKIGKEIVKNCKGVPLSAKVIGSAMNSKRTAQDWQNILESETWALRDVAKGILPALLLSYYNLPTHLKQCFAYCSIFPKEHDLEKDTLVKLWLAQGFIRSEGNRDMEEIGREYFDDLLARSLFQDVELGRVSCKMHDLLHDLAEFITKKECQIIEIGKSDLGSVEARHSSLIVSDDVSIIPTPLCNVKKLRTFLLIGPSKIDTVPLDLFEHVRFLRSLDFSWTDIKRLPSSIGNLKHLRYLNLSSSGIEELPESMSHLSNLQTLKLNGCRSLCKLPRRMSAMVSLRHLEIERTDKLEHLPEGLGKVTSLRTLSKFVVGGDRGCMIGELKHLNLLQENLEIKSLERVASGDEAKEAELEKKLRLRRLSLQMSGDGNVESMNDVFECLRPPCTNLEELEIQNYIGSKFPTWMDDSSLSSLVKVELVNCNNCTQLPQLGKLPSLKHLEIQGNRVKLVGREFYGNSGNRGGKRVAFPKLEELYFRSMPKFKEWELRLEEGEIMPSLLKLVIRFCAKLKALPQSLPNTLRHLEIEECSKINGISCSLPLLTNFQLCGSDGILLRPLPGLLNLRKFEIGGLPNATSLPDGWEQLEALESLSVSFCSKLRSLPDRLRQLKMLKRLDISNCPKLGSLPEGLQDLRALEDLEINGCRLLVERCKEGGEDWHKIAHVANVWVDGNKIQ
ncbi:putative disease resistance protein RGA3 [Magnolia sinica]|uniref:putative disease resistance protein RGA3 n=1 Tax=Magnolia sinica TaxID=86752 RepID=UPI00265AE145|nr:putative disease resistance protein RGA3 [Magnolia sinica]